MSRSQPVVPRKRTLGRVLAIGDIHGCSTALDTLLAAVAPQPNDRIVLLGDVVDRGPDSRAVIESLLALADTCHVTGILGNHEEMMLAVIDGEAPHRWLQCGGVATLDSYGFSGSLDVIPERHVAFLRSFTEVVEVATHFFTHASYQPDLPLTGQPRRALRWQTVTPVSPAPHCSGKIAVVGHTALRHNRILDLPHLKCIDTWCYGGGCLTAYDIASGALWQANEQGEVVSKNLCDAV